MKKPKTNHTQAFIRLQCFTMYRDGSSLQEIAQHFHISREHVSDNISAYLNHDMMDDDDLDQQHIANRMNRTSAHVAEIMKKIEPDEDHIDVIIQNRYGLKPKPLEPQRAGWFTRCCIHVHSFFFFWK